MSFLTLQYGFPFSFTATACSWENSFLEFLLDQMTNSLVRNTNENFVAGRERWTFGRASHWMARMDSDRDGPMGVRLANINVWMSHGPDKSPVEHADPLTVGYDVQPWTNVGTMLPAHLPRGNNRLSRDDDSDVIRAVTYLDKNRGTWRRQLIPLAVTKP